MFNFRSAADVSDARSLSNRLRNRWFKTFEALLNRLGKSRVDLIDVGGTENFWRKRGCADRPDVSITCINLEARPSSSGNIRVLQGDATDLKQFSDEQFDVAFSNSVIEHLFSLENQPKMANEIRRGSLAHWVQTPNY